MFLTDPRGRRRAAREARASALADALCTAYRAAEPLAGAFSIVAAFALFFSHEL